ncbi:hypothetical protein [Streptomyces fungicidicus]|uniref:hypothetical protein n=1 Tax=Streptomyces fungicidicus TaxID=68203 RepID=UPI0036945663
MSSHIAATDTASAGSARRRISAVSAPTARAHSPYATVAGPRATNTSAKARWSPMRSRCADHPLRAGRRAGVTPCVHAGLAAPDSSSRPIGAPPLNAATARKP